MGADRTIKGLGSWSDLVAALAPVSDNLAEKWPREPIADTDRFDLDRLILSALAGGYLSHVHLNTLQPVFAPLWNHALNMGGPCPDFIYMVTDIDPTGTYRISGHRGTSRFVDIVQTGWEMLGVSPPVGGLPAHDPDTLSIGDDGRISVILSPERPQGHDGDWWELKEGCRKLMIRHCACDWANEIDARLAITRLDRFEAPPREEIARRMTNVPAWTEGIVSFGMRLAYGYRDKFGVNTLDRVQYPGTDQYYYDAWYELAEDEALIIDSAVPENYRYWSILVANDRFSTVDWVYRQSSLNDTQAQIDSDGRLRMVVSGADPGVPNWLDSADNRCGIIQYRLNRADDIPVPGMKKVPIGEVRQHLPENTPVVSPEERADALRLRAEAAQMRSLW